MTPRFYFDTNAVGNAFPRFDTKTSQALRSRIRSAFLKDLTFVASIPLFEELAEFCKFDWRKYRSIYEFVFDLSEHRILKERNDRSMDEVRNSAWLKDDGQYCSRQFRRQFQAATRVRANAVRVADAVSGRKRRWRLEAETSRRAVIQALERNGTSKAGVKGAWKTGVLRPNEFVIAKLMERRTEFQLPSDQSSWPSPDSLPTLWLAEAYALVRTIQTVADERRIDASDIYDLEHVAAGGYFDVMVTDDRALTEVLGLIPGLPFQVETFADFQRRL